MGAADWVHLEALDRYPLKIALSEGGIGWVPYFLERADFSHQQHKAWTRSHLRDRKPSDVFKKHHFRGYHENVCRPAPSFLIRGPKE